MQNSGADLRDVEFRLLIHIGYADILRMVELGYTEEHFESLETIDRSLRDASDSADGRLPSWVAPFGAAGDMPTMAPANAMPPPGMGTRVAPEG
jgi:hypothetical protein